MTMTLTERDKKLLVFLGIFIVLVGLGWFVVRPLYNGVAETKAELVAAQEEEIAVNEKIMTLNSKKIVLEKVSAELDEEAKIMYAVMQSQQVDKLLTELALSLNCEARNLLIIIPEEFFTSVPYRYSELATSTTATAMEGVYAAKITMDLGGERDELQYLLDTLLNSYPAIRISSFSWSTLTARGTSSEYILNIDAEIYMFILN